MMPTAAEPTALSYLARRGVAPQWRGFLRALLETLDAHLDATSRDDLLRTVGGRMAAQAPLPACSDLGELEARMNDALAAAEWGWVEIALDPHDRALILGHCGAPAIATAADPAGGWIAAVLEGMYGTWLAAQPGAEAGVAVRRTGVAAARITLRYGRG